MPGETAETAPAENATSQPDEPEKPAADGEATKAAEDAAPEPEAPPEKEVRTVVLSGYGGINKVKVMRRSEPKPAEGEILVRVKACGLNFLDLMVRQGNLENPPKCPAVMGYECAGVVEALGEGVTGFEVGAHVLALSNLGAWCELVAVPAKHCFQIPMRMSFEDAAAFPINFLTAYIMLFEIGNLKKGKSVLVHSAGGGVGLAVAQLCKTVENVTVFGTASPHKHDTIKDHFDHLFLSGSDYTAEIRKLSPSGVDIVLDCLCGDDTNKGIALLKPMGKYVLYGSSNIVTGETRSFFSSAKAWWQVDKVNPVKLYDENKTIGGFQLLRLLYDQDQHELIRETMATLLDMFSNDRIKPVIDSCWAFEEVGEAMQKMHDHQNIGKLILDPGMDKTHKTPAETPDTSDADEVKGQQNEETPPAEAAAKE
ncbi:synaptic vesicle membrane protein VAT-1 homolog-like [Branchiostoma floridae]|uniref:Synaptic vesicle membrane protein VAT-1 homolog-like n=1 Tax=Branchiostoma floridae TaxID=7739 RepID=C3XU34_BRAFL|nr:synaptic vesicle membrane protein VAT-1 homolog-like [Branchiostoma floridae]|eukprot:XP_002612399.1 hypothetical protein BRAFLDRAFT_78257 [Branchiostoma floridae]